ncbi:hypothetical protein GQ607_001803 [Colletotrichum asianum]|uniref:Uncharacterized protein n=1 Tax=Colletotrichum asianum TaxID=702518 RepID=A0A8H3WQ22_9PEZI|nr:hypothetical protein GQ607_001803 [Colletotrichum asianum]
MEGVGPIGCVHVAASIWHYSLAALPHRVVKQKKTWTAPCVVDERLLRRMMPADAWFSACLVWLSHLGVVLGTDWLDC